MVMLAILLLCTLWDRVLTFSPRSCVGNVTPSSAAQSYACFSVVREGNRLWGGTGAAGREVSRLWGSSSAPDGVPPLNLPASWDVLRKTLRGTNVYFVGMMGSGKSTVGQLFAKNLGYRYLDTDEIAEHMISMPIADYFKQGKEAEFRELEYQILMEISQYTRLVLSTGGGIVEKNENWGVLHHGIVVLLDLTPEDIYKRLSANPEQVAKRPLLQGDSPLTKLQELDEKRRDKYSQADVKVQVPAIASNDEVAQIVCDSLIQFIATNPPIWDNWKKKREQRLLDEAGEKASIFNPAVVEAKVDVEGKGGDVDGNVLQ